MIPEDLKYTESHEWIRREGDIATIGIADYAQDQLSDIVFVELPDVDSELEQGEECTVIESCKIAAELYAPVSGKIVEVNEGLTERPELINQDPYGAGWIMKIELSDPFQLDALLDAAAYQEHIESGE